MFSFMQGRDENILNGKVETQKTDVFQENPSTRFIHFVVTLVVDDMCFGEDCSDG